MHQTDLYSQLMVRETVCWTKCLNSINIKCEKAVFYAGHAIAHSATIKCSKQFENVHIYDFPMTNSLNVYFHPPSHLKM